MSGPAVRAVRYPTRRYLQKYPDKGYVWFASFRRNRADDDHRFDALYYNATLYDDCATDVYGLDNCKGKTASPFLWNMSQGLRKL